MNDLIIMERQNIVDVADAIRNKTGVNDEMTLVDMVTSINDIELGSEELPSAENSAFGVARASEEYGIISPEALGEQSAAVSGVTGMEFKAREPIAIAGLRVKPARASNTSLKLCLWNENAELLQQTSVITTTRNWLYAYFDTPVNINADEIFIASVQSQSNFPYRKKSGVTFNGKLSFQAGRTGASGAGYAGFPDSRNTSNIYGIVDVIIVPVQAEQPDTYKIERTTMDDIAEEMQRITGTETKMSVAQMQSGLESVVLQEKSVTPTTETQTITPDSNYYGLSKVTVNPALLQEKTVTPTTEQQEIVPDTGYYGLSKVTIEAVEDNGGVTIPENAALYYKGFAGCNVDISSTLKSNFTTVALEAAID